MSRARVIVVVALALVCSACALGIAPGTGTAPPWAGKTGTAKVAEHCVRRLDRAGYLEAFQVIRSPAWDGADMSVAAVVDDSTRVWLFGDTFTGVIGADGGIENPYNLLHNSLVVQRGKCFKFYMGVTNGTISELIPDPVKRQRYWPVGAYPVKQGGRVTEIRVLAIHGQKPRGYEGPFSIRLVGAVIARLSWPDLRVRAVIDLGAPGGLIMRRIIDGADGWHYIYAHSVEANPRNYVARAHDADLARGRMWWWDGSGWSLEVTDAAPMRFFDGDVREEGPYSPIFVVADGRGYIASTTRVELVADDVTAWWSTTPWGPWTTASAQKGRVATLPMKRGILLYGGHVSVLPELGLTVIFNHSPGFAGVVAKASSYGPRFAAPVDLEVPWRPPR